MENFDTATISILIFAALGKDELGNSAAIYSALPEKGKDKIR